MLDERGNHMREGDAELIDKSSKQIATFLDKNKDYYRRPICAYVTFRSIEGS